MTATSTVAWALADVLGTALSWGSAPVDVTKSWMPQYELGDLDTLRVIVVPGTCARLNAARGSTQRDHTIQVGILMRAKNDEDDTTVYDALDAFAQSVADAVDTSDLGLPGVRWVSTTHESLAVPDHLREMRQFTGVLSVLYREVVAR